jgi:hypothetical protein
VRRIKVSVSDRRRLTAGSAVAGLILGLMGAATFDAAAAHAETRREVMRAAAQYASSNGYRVGIVVRDTRTGTVQTAGAADAEFVSASVIKTLIATRLLVEGKVHGNTARLAYRMITLSDNDATNRLYPRAGGRTLIPWTERHYGIRDLGTPTPKTLYWGYTTLVPRALAEFYAKVKRDPLVAPWLLNAMHHIATYSYVGQYQWWGLPSATAHAAVKQGWDTAFGHANVNTTGYVNGDRYVVVIMSRGPTSSYLGPISRMITHVARLLLPDGEFPEPTPHVDRLSKAAAPTRGGWQVTLRGTSFTDVSDVLFGGEAATSVTVVSPRKIVATVPPHAPGGVTVRVVTSHGTSPRTDANRFRFMPAPTVTSVRPPVSATAGGTTIAVLGSAFTHVHGVLVGDMLATSFAVTRESKLTATVPAHDTGIVDVRVITAYGKSARVPADHYLYDDPQPSVAGASATVGSQSVDVSWTNPTNAGFAGVKVCRSTDPTPLSKGCSALVTVVAADSGFSDTNVVAGTAYYYTLFAVDTFQQYSAAVTVSVTA